MKKTAAVKDALLERFPNLRLANERPQPGGNLILHGLKTLPVSF
jgi:cytochrome P450